MNPKRAKELLDQFSGKRVLVVGDAVLDRYVFGKVERLNPEAPVPILHAKEEKRATGGAGNTAKNAAALGAKTTLVSVVGQDEAGETIADLAAKEGYTPNLVVDPKRPTTEKIRYTVRSQQILRVDYEEAQDISGGVEKNVSEQVRSVGAETDAIIVSDYAKGVVTEAAAKAVMDAGTMTMADVKPSRIHYFSGASLISPNRKEAHEYLGLNPHDHNGAAWDVLAGKLRDTFGATVFLTLSEEGIYVLGKDGGAHVPQEHEIEVADTSGAGDTAAVVITLAKLSGASDVEAAELANAAGAVVVQKVGAVAVTPEEILDMVSHTHA